ncbi:MAG TPA: hypothetical protein PKB00_16705 [Microthrixaceae bacterium]|nr:hypothetical protein [Microthrixaceae bacterium]
MTTPQSTISGTRRVRFVGAALAAVAVVLLSACAPPTGPTTPGQTYKEGRCAADEGVTVVVDFAPLQDRVVVRCALGAQPSGTGALAAVNLPVDPGPITGGVCEIDGLPTQGYPYCWTTGGYWSYWKAATAGAPWSYSTVGAAANAIPAGAVEGWRFAAFSAGTAVPPRVGTSGPIVP